MTDGIVGHVASTGEEVILSDAYTDDRFSPMVDEMTGYKTQSVLCLPLKADDGRIIGVTQMINKREGHFLEEDKILLKVGGVEKRHFFEIRTRLSLRSPRAR